MNFSLVEWAHDTPGKIVSYQLIIKTSGIECINQLDIPELVKLYLLIQDTLESNKERFSERFFPLNLK